ncbi:ParB/RepB/Spo0J family partition protein [uncultured Sphingomonas sp.]|uniref:ParB/RepB/Spo0J family partition protein n=1 Tax=uncultured Sphingomonas sp. TaxID=158754 RepID=UPI0025D14907|nr:ParB/RepB/Spo0J family partition protein [uncultured Sphingomonas sp.]
MSSTTLTIDQIDISPLNVRTYRPDIEDTTALEDSILERGLIQPIAVHPMMGSKRWGAIAGGRRTRAIKALVARDALPRDWQVPVTQHVGLSDAELIEISINENLIRRDLREHELFAGVARAAAKGHDAETIARSLGQDDVAKVKRWIRLGQLAKPIFEALAVGRLTIDQARAYAATEDAALQAATYLRLSAGPPHAHTPGTIRLAMNIGDVEQRRQLAFVGADAYRAAGGWLEPDMFAEPGEDRGRIADVGILQKLVEARMEGLRAEVRAAYGRPDLRFVPKPPQTSYDVDDYHLQASPKTDESGSSLPDGDVVGLIRIDAAGKPVVSFWWASRTAKAAGAPKPDAPVSTGPVPKVHPGAAIDSLSSPGARRDADAAIKEEAGLGKDAIELLRSMRRVLLRSALVRNADMHGDVGRDYLVWAQARQILGADTGSRVGMRRLQTDDIGGFDLSQKARALIDETGAAGPYAAAIREVSAQSFMKGGNLVEAFLDFQASSDRLKNMTAAIVAGFALERSLSADGYALPIHDAVAVATCAADPAVLRETWTPSAGLVALTPKSQRPELVAELVDDATRDVWRTKKGDEVTEHVLRAATASEEWVHPLLRFDPPSCTAGQKEAAE